MIKIVKCAIIFGTGYALGRIARRYYNKYKAKKEQEKWLSLVRRWNELKRQEAELEKENGTYDYLKVVK